MQKTGNGGNAQRDSPIPWFVVLGPSTDPNEQSDQYVFEVRADQQFRARLRYNNRYSTLIPCWINQDIFARHSSRTKDMTMPEIEIFEDKTVLVGKRRKGKDETLEDAMKTMERFSDWLISAQNPAGNAWLQADAISTAMLYGMLTHLREDIERLLALGGEEARSTYEFFQRMKRTQ